MARVASEGYTRYYTRKVAGDIFWKRRPAWKTQLQYRVRRGGWRVETASRPINFHYCRFFTGPMERRKNIFLFSFTCSRNLSHSVFHDKTRVMRTPRLMLPRWISQPLARVSRRLTAGIDWCWDLRLPYSHSLRAGAPLVLSPASDYDSLAPVRRCFLPGPTCNPN